MRILIVSTYDLAGGAAIAAFRLHEALLGAGVESRMLVYEKKSDLASVVAVDKNVFEKNVGKLAKAVRRAVNRLPLLKYQKTKSRKYATFSTQKADNFKLVKTINGMSPDIVNLHWVCRDFLSIEDIARIRAPIVWSLHDVWAFTGGCHCVCDNLFDGKEVECDEYVRDCGNCGILGSKIGKDLSFDVLQRKKRVFASVKNMTVVGLSGWMVGCARKSAVFADKKVVNIPNPINTQIFRPLPKKDCREFWKLPADKKLILFGAVSATSRAYKGYDLLIEALNKLETKDFECVVFGADEPENPPKTAYKVNYLGNLKDNDALVKLYGACDVTVVPSRRENLSNVIMESMSCSAPVVCFDIGGNSDMVEHEKNGYVARTFDTSDLASGIDWVLSGSGYDDLRRNAREKIVREFDSGVVVKRYLRFYGEVLKSCET